MQLGPISREFVSNFVGPKVWGQNPEKVGAHRVGARGSGEAQNFALIFPCLTTIIIISSLSWGSSRGVVSAIQGPRQTHTHTHTHAQNTDTEHTYTQDVGLDMHVVHSSRRNGLSRPGQSTIGLSSICSIRNWRK